MARPINTALQDVFLENYFKCTGNITEACKRTVYNDGKKDRTLSRDTVQRWFKRKEFLKKLKQTRARWRDDLFRVAMAEATGAPKKVGQNAMGQEVVLERHRPVPVLLMFLLKGLEPEKWDDAYRIQLLRQEGSAKLFDRYPLAPVVFEGEAMPDRFKKDQAVKLPPEYTTPPPKTKENQIPPRAEESDECET